LGNKIRTNFKIIQKCGPDRFGGFRTLEWAWQKVFGKSIKIHKNMKKYQNLLQKCERGSFGRLVGVVTWILRLCR